MIELEAGLLVPPGFRQSRGVSVRRDIVGLDNPIPGQVSLIMGQDDETGILTNCTAVADTTNFKIGDRGWKLTSAASGFMIFALDPVPPLDPVVAPKWQALSAWIYIYDVTKLVTNDVTLYIYTDAGLTTPARWGKNASAFPSQTLVNGWNLIRIPANYAALPADPNSIYRVAVVINTNTAGAQVTIGHVWLECRPKASVMLVADRGYSTFYRNAYPALKATKIPVTFAIDTTTPGTGAGDAAVMTQAQFDAVAAENGNSISFHGYDGAATSGMTAAQLRADTAKAIRYMQAHGYTGRVWRAAFPQQDAPQYAAIAGMVVGSGSGLTADADKWNMWPPADMMRISRRGMDDFSGKTPATFAANFAYLQATNGLDVYFVHGVGGNGTYDTSQSLFNYWLQLVSDGINAGWLEAVTFEDLYTRSGGRFQTLRGPAIAEYRDETGTAVTKALP